MAAVGRTIATPFVKLGSRVSSFLSPVTTQVSALFSKVVSAAGPAASRLVSSFGAGVSQLGSAAASGLQSVVSAAQRAGSAAGQALGSGLKNAATAGVVAGLALIHGLVARKRLATFWLVGLYVVLLVFMQLIYPLLVVLAIVDGLIDFRGRLASKDADSANGEG